MQLTFDIPSPNEKWDAEYWILVQGSATKEHLPSEKIWVFNCFRQIFAGGTSPAAEKFSHGQSRRRQCSIAIRNWILQLAL